MGYVRRGEDGIADELHVEEGAWNSSDLWCRVRLVNGWNSEDGGCR